MCPHTRGVTTHVTRKRGENRANLSYIQTPSGKKKKEKLTAKVRYGSVGGVFVQHTQNPRINSSAPMNCVYLLYEHLR